MASGDVFDALADPIRRDLLERLARGSERVVDLAAAHDVTRPAISRHLRILGEAGLVEATDRGRERHYALVRTPLGEVQHFLDRLARSGPPVSDVDLDALETEVRRTARDRRTAASATRTTRMEHTA